MAESGKVFKRTHLESLCKEKLKELGHPCPNINPTRFKDHLLNNLPAGWHRFTKGRDVFLSNSNTVGEALARHVNNQKSTRMMLCFWWKQLQSCRNTFSWSRILSLVHFHLTAWLDLFLNHCSPSCWCYFRVRRQISKALAGLMMEIWYAPKVEGGERSLPTHHVQCCPTWLYIWSHNPYPPQKGSWDTSAIVHWYKDAQ